MAYRSGRGSGRSTRASRKRGSTVGKAGSTTSGRGSGRTTKSSRSRTTESISVPGTSDRVKYTKNRRMGGGSGRVVRGKRR